MALRAMHNTGLVQALFPEWQNIVCLVVPDYYHRYTVDEHTMLAIEKLTELDTAEDPIRKRFAEILSEIATWRCCVLRCCFMMRAKGRMGRSSRRFDGIGAAGDAAHPNA